MNQLSKLTKQQLIDLVVSLQPHPTVLACPIDKDPTLWEQPTFPNTPDDVPATEPKAAEPVETKPAPRMRSYEVYINGVLKHTIIIPNNEQEACRRANWIAKQAALKGWPTRVKCVML